MTNQTKVSVSDGFKFGLGFTLGSFVASAIILPALACLGFLILTLVGSSLGALMNSF
ncbi:hypothetical protein KC799_00515 [candidate division KSB1 bacterium]|nr:hypothetical protein [candidate division KSB1 bacterium]